MLFFVTPGTLLFGIIAIAKRRKGAFEIGRKWERFVLFITGGKVPVSGAQNLIQQ